MCPKMRRRIWTSFLRSCWRTCWLDRARLQELRIHPKETKPWAPILESTEDYHVQTDVDVPEVFGKFAGDPCIQSMVP